MPETIVFIHGAWVTARCWKKFTGFFEGRGYQCLAPAWPGKDMSVDELRRHPPKTLAGLGIADIVDHYDRIVRGLNEPPVLIGHSFGGLFVQLLLDRGLGRAGVAIHSAPPKGVLPLHWSTIRSNLGVLSTWRGWERVVTMSFPQFQYVFVNALAPADQRAAYDEHVVPETGRIFFPGGPGHA